MNLLEKDLKINWEETLKNYKNLYDEYIELKRIIEAYFDVNELMEEIKAAKKF